MTTAQRRWLILLPPPLLLSPIATLFHPSPDMMPLFHLRRVQITRFRTLRMNRHVMRCSMRHNPALPQSLHRCTPHLSNTMVSLTALHPALYKASPTPPSSHLWPTM